MLYFKKREMLVSIFQNTIFKWEKEKTYVQVLTLWRSGKLEQ